MSQPAFQLTPPERISEAGNLEPNARQTGPEARVTDPEARFSEIRALSRPRARAANLLPLWFESTCLGLVLALTLASYLLMNLDFGGQGNFIATITVSALSCATIAAGLSRVRRANVFCLFVLSLAAVFLAWFAFAATGDSLEAQPARDAFEATPG